MQATPANLAALADEFLVAYACTSSVEPSFAALFNVGHAAELYLKAAILAIDPSCDVGTYKHNLAALLRDIQAREAHLLTSYALRQRAIDLYLYNVELPEEARVDPDYDHFNCHREWYWVSANLMDTKYLFAAQGRKLAGKGFVIMVGGLNDYWHPFFRQLRTYLRTRDVPLSQHLLKASSSPHVIPHVQAYLRALL